MTATKPDTKPCATPLKINCSVVKTPYGVFDALLSAETQTFSDVTNLVF
jgi:hypothetical protein